MVWIQLALTIMVIVCATISHLLDRWHLKKFRALLDEQKATFDAETTRCEQHIQRQEVMLSALKDVAAMIRIRRSPPPPEPS